LKYLEKKESSINSVSNFFFYSRFDVIPNRKKYHLTNKGIISLTSLQVIEQLMNNQITPDELINKYYSKKFYIFKRTSTN